MAKELCKIKKALIEYDIDAYCQLVDKPRFVCRRCGRAANKKKYVCKPTRIK